ncbi:MAG TPA: pitrilysin family protein [Beijerinckiaceae bacterium]|jgi:predicted Zn-dependent peptidase|nr:pitrilysin family protein [Beijerinckiaceae bacterium]
MSIEITTLPSGLRIVSDAMRDLETASLGVWVAAGSRHEAAQEHGLSHLLEHMAFKGTRRRSARDIADEIETAGGDLNAATSVEQTAYYARVLAADTGLALDILADILTDSVFDPAELKREKDVILQEIGAVEDTPDDLVFDLFNAAAFPEQPIGRPILGTPEKVAAFDRASLSSYLDRHYGAPVTVVAAAGAVEHGRIVDDAARRFEGMAANTHLSAVPARYSGGDRRLDRKLEQTHIVVGFEGRSFHDPNAYAAHIFANAVGGGMSSRLFQEVREKRGLVYEIYSFHWAYADTGLFGFYAATSPRDVAALLPVALDCLGQAVQDLDEAEVLRAKAQMKVSLLAALESSAARAEQIARQLLAFGRVLPREEIISEIDNLTLADIRRAGSAMLSTPATVAVVGKTAKVPTPERIAETLKGV